MTPPRFDSFDRRSTAWFGRHRLWLVPLFAAVLVPAGVAATRLETDNSVERWLGERDPAMRKFQRFRREFDVRPQVTAVLEGLRPDDPRVERCAAAIDRSELVRHVLTPHRLCRDVELPVRALEQTPLGRLLVPEGRSTALWIELTDEAAAESRETVERFRALAEGCEIPRDALHLGGPPVIDAALDKWGGESLRTLLPAVIAVCGLSLWILVRSLRQTLALVATASASVVLTLAVMAVWGERLNLLLTALPPLVGVLHLSIGIHLLHHFNACTPPLNKGGVGGVRRASSSTDATTATVPPPAPPYKGGERELEFRNRQEDEPSIGRAIRATFPPSCLASVTTIIGMLSLLVVDLQPLRAFGLWGAVGVLVSLFVAYSLLPCLLMGSKRAQPLMLSCGWVSPRFRWARGVLFAATGLVIVGSVVGWTRLEPEFNTVRFLPEGCRAMRDHRWIEEHSGGLIPVECILDLKQEPDPQARLATAARLARRIEGHPAVTNVLGIHLFGDSFHAQWISPDGNRYRLSALVHSEQPTQFGNLPREIEAMLNDVPAEVTGPITLLDRSQRAVFDSLRDSLLLACVSIGAVLIVVLRSVRAGLVALVPNLLPIAVGFGLIGWSGRPLDVGTVLTASIALGIALDDSLHFLHHYRRVSATTANRGRTARQTWQTCSWPMIQTTYITGTALLVLTGSVFRPIVHYGGLMTVLMTIALVADLILLPYLLTTPVARLFRKA